MRNDDFTEFEPLFRNRWLVNIQGIPAYIFKSFKLETESIGDNGKCGLRLTLESLNPKDLLMAPDDFINTKKIMIEFLDPTGVKINHYDMVVELDKFITEADYSEGGLLISKSTFWVKKLDTIYNSVIDEKIINNYKKTKSNT